MLLPSHGHSVDDMSQLGLSPDFLLPHLPSEKGKPPYMVRCVQQLFWGLDILFLQSISNIKPEGDFNFQKTFCYDSC